MLNTIFRQERRSNGAVNPAYLSFLRYLAEDDADQQAHYQRLRAWYDGAHYVPLTDRQRQYLAVDSQFQFAVNYLRLPVDLCIERLSVTGFDGPDGIGGRDGLLAEWWEANRMDGAQGQIHRAAVRDGDTYVIVEWDNDAGRPVFMHEPAFDGVEGVKVHYLGNTRREMTFASKRWSERRMDDSGQFVTTRRLNIYRPDAIEKYIESGRGWQPLDDGQPWPTPWPAGVIPVVHFRWQDDGRNFGESELEPLIPLQMALNKSVMDLLESADKSASQAIFITGGKMPDNMTYKAGDIMSVASPNGGPIGITVVPGADLSNLRAVVNDFIIRMAQVSHIPLQYFQLTGAVASAETQAADDSQLTSKVRAESVSLGNAWEDAMRIALRLNAEFGDGRNIAPDDKLTTLWADFERVDTLAVEQKRADILAALIAAGISLPGALARVGYPEDDIAVMLQGDVITGIEQ